MAVSLTITEENGLSVVNNPVVIEVVNATAPEPVTNAGFTGTLARVVRRPALFPVPAPATTSNGPSPCSTAARCSSSSL